ncbi:MAG TPA: MoxR family ATPase [Acidimicrobiales bacterium]|nr:MoxR family ATPase [Acidimicrobiales bacterium]
MSTARTRRPDDLAQHFSVIADNIAHAIQGKSDVIHLVLVALLADGHLLLEDVPGVGKTSLAKALAISIDGTFGRVQFTPDLLPSDVTGVNVWDRANSRFEFHPGPIFANVVLGDELNRASPKTQSALLEAMAEQQVTVDGVTYHLRDPFMVIATQNPLEHEGTHPLPDSQLDRFLLRLSMGYPARSAELDILSLHEDHAPLSELGPVVTADAIAAARAGLRAVHVAPALRGYLVDLAHATRQHPAVAIGMSPRATLSLQRTARARAALDGRAYVIPDDIKALAEPVIAHRLVLAPEAELRGITAADVVHDALTGVPVPAARQPG